MKERIFRIGLPNRGRLGQLCRSIFINNLRMLPESAMDSRKYYHTARDGQSEFIFARSKDLPRLVSQGTVDACITGKDYVEDSGEKLKEIIDLDLCPGEVDILVPNNSQIRTPQELQGLTIATQLPRIAEKWVQENNLDRVAILVNEGANEVFPYLGLAHATLDVVSTGDTARANELIPIIRVLYSSGRLYTSEASYEDNSQKLDELANGLYLKYLRK